MIGYCLEWIGAEYGSSYLGYQNSHSSSITISSCHFRIGTFLDLSFDLFGSNLDGFPVAFHNQVALRNDLIKGNQKIEGIEVLPGLMFQPIGVPEGLGEIQMFVQSVLNTADFTATFLQDRKDQLIPLCSGGGLMNFHSGRFASLSSCSNFSRAPL